MMGHKEIHRDPGLPPQISLTGKTRDHFEARVPARHSGKIDLSITDEPPYAQAFVVLSSVPFVY
jgi:holo-[acyl-carrier protein] synthase